MLKYQLTYSDNKVVIKQFKDEKEAQWYFHNEGDHLVQVKKLRVRVSVHPTVS